MPLVTGKRPNHHERGTLMASVLSNFFFFFFVMVILFLNFLYIYIYIFLKMVCVCALWKGEVKVNFGGFFYGTIFLKQSTPHLHM